MSAKSQNSIISSISSSSCPSTFFSLNSTTTTHLPIKTNNNKNNWQLYSTFSPSVYAKQNTLQHSSIYRNSWANILTDIGENTKEKYKNDNKHNNNIKSEFSYRKAINWIKTPWKNIKPTSSNINNNEIFPPPPYEEKIQNQEYNNYLKNQNYTKEERRNDIYSYAGRINNTHQLIYFSGPAPFPLSAQPATPTSGHSSIHSSVGRLASLTIRQSSGNLKIKRNRMQELRDVFNNKSSCRIFCMAILLLIIIALIVIGVISSHFNLPNHIEFVWIAPEQLRFGTEKVITPIHGRLDVGQIGKQARLELTGTPPFRSNFVSILDFQTNKIAVMDMSLRVGVDHQNNQQNRYMLVCFVIDLDRQNIADLDELLKAAKAGAKKLNQLHGWENNWQWTVIPLNQPPLFQPEIAECRGARWVHLSKTNNNGDDQKIQKCSECFDFCLPDWGIQKDVVRDENYLNILRQICFSLFVPEWRPFAQAPLGGQQKGQIIDLYNGQEQQNKNNIVLPDTNNLNLLQNIGPSETKWISLKTPRIEGRENTDGAFIDQNRLLPSFSNVAFAPSSSFSLQFPSNQEQIKIKSPIIGQQSFGINNWMSKNVGGYEDEKQFLSFPSVENKNKKMSEIQNGQQSFAARQFWWS